MRAWLAGRCDIVRRTGNLLAAVTKAGGLVAFTLALALFRRAAFADVVPVAAAVGGTTAWQERFDHEPLGWVDPFDHGAAKLGLVYSVQHEGPFSFLHAHYDGTSNARPPALDYGKAFKDHPIELDKVRALRWRWRALRHPTVGADPWLDCAASVYVVIKVPSMVAGGRGFKFAWLAKPGALGTHQHGLLQVALTNDPAGTAWLSESVDLCGMYRQQFGPCEGQHVLYVGVMTDGDGTQSLAEADYADFQLVTSP
jgi:hypothetical protein